MTRGRPPKKRPDETAGESAEQIARGYIPEDQLAEAERAAGAELTESPLARLVLTSDPGSRFRVYRVSDQTARQVFHGNLTRDEASESKIAELFGGGRYWVQLLKRNATGGDTVERQCKIEIPGAYRPPMHLPGTMAPAPASPASADAVPARDTLSPREQLDYAAATRLIETLQAKPASTWQPVLLAIAPALAAGAIELVKNAMRPARTDPAVLAILEELRADRARAAHAPGPVTHGLKDVLGSLRQLDEMRTLIGGGAAAGGEDAMWNRLLELGSKLLPAGNAPAEPVTDPATQQAADTRPPWHRLLAFYGDRLVDAASTNKSADFTAQVIAEFVPDEWSDVLGDFVHRPTAAGDVVIAVPAMAPYATWTDKLLAALKEIFVADDAPPDAPENA